MCKEFDLPLFLDGARLGYGLTADTDVTLPDIARLTDVFYIGGTKCGALCGEAVVFTHGNMPRQFETMVKRHGAMVAKGRLNALQFDALFTDGLYEKICAPAVKLAIKLRDGLKAKGYRFALESPTNQQFIIVENSRLPELGGKVAYSFIEKYDAEHTVIRLATSWATTEEQVDELLNYFKLNPRIESIVEKQMMKANILEAKKYESRIRTAENHAGRSRTRDEEKLHRLCNERYCRPCAA